MAWSRFEDNFYDNDKALSLSHQGFRLYVCSIPFSTRHKTGGFLSNVQAHALARLHNVAPEETITELLTLNCWHEVEGGYLIHDYADYHPDDATGADRQRRFRERKKAEKEAGSVAVPSVTPPLRDRYANGSSRASESPEPEPEPEPEYTAAPLPPEGGGGGDPVWEKLKPDALLRRYRDEFPEREPELQQAIASATGPVRSQAAYLKPFILRRLSGLEPLPVGVPETAISIPVPSRKEHQREQSRRDNEAYLERIEKGLRNGTHP